MTTPSPKTTMSINENATNDDDDYECSTTQPSNSNMKKMITVWLAIFAFFYITDPSQPFLVPYFATKGISTQTVLYSIFPIWTYSMPIVQIIVGVVSESKIGHKWLITSGAILNIVVLVIVLLCTERQLWLIQVSEVIVAWLFSCHQSFFALRYHVTSPENYQFITGLTRGVMLIGQVFGGVIGQSLYLAKVPLHYLFYIAIAFSIPCILISMFIFPSPKDYVVPIDVNPKTLQRGRGREGAEDEYALSQDITESKSSSLLRSLWSFPRDLFNCYVSNFEVLFWSCFMIASVPVHHLAVTYYQTLFRTLDKDRVFNGFLTALAYLFAGLLSLLPARMEKVVERYGTYLGTLLSMLSAICLLLLSFKGMPVFLYYILYVVYHCLFEFTLVMGMSQIAKNLVLSRFAAVFSLNACAQNLVQVAIQFIVGKRVLHLGALEQYRAFGLCMMGSVVISLILLCARFVTSVTKCCIASQSGSENDQVGTSEQESVSLVD